MCRRRYAQLGAMMRIYGAGGGAVIVLLSISAASAATGALGARLDVFPSAPRATYVATVQLRPYRKVGSDVLPTALHARTKWHVVAVSIGAKDRAAVLLRISRDLRNPYVWTASIRFPTRGRWIIRADGPARVSLRVNVVGRSASSVWHELERPILIPSQGRAAPCPVSKPDPNGDLSRFGGPRRPAWGLGPAYPSFVSVRADRPVLEYEYPISRRNVYYGSRWSGNKLPWRFDRAAYKGPLLIRGRQLNGMDVLRFGQSAFPAPDLRVVVEDADMMPSSTRVRRRGCYGFQLDGLSFTRVIIFEAIPHRPQ